MALPCGKGENKLCFVSLTPTTLQLSAAGLEIDPLDGFACFVFFVFFKSADSHKRFSHLGIIVALRVYILMVKGKK